MTTNTILLLQSFLIFGQMVNAGIGTITHNQAVAVILAAGVGAVQFYVQHIGNQTTPTK